MQIENLKYFTEVADLKSISKVANNSHISQPALSHQLSKLENELGANLLKRSNKGVELTGQGQILYNYAKEILLSYNSLVEEIGIKDDANNELRITSSGISANFLVSNISMNIIKIFKNFDVNISNNWNINHQVSLINNKSDIVVGTEAINDVDLASNYIGSDSLILVSRNKVKKENIDEITIALLDDGYKNNLEISIPNIKIKTNSLTTIKNYLKNDKTGAIVPKVAVKEELNTGELINLEYNEYELKYNLFVTYKKDIDSALKSKITMFIKELENVLNEK